LTDQTRREGLALPLLADLMSIENQGTLEGMDWACELPFGSGGAGVRRAAY